MPLIIPIPRAKPANSWGFKGFGQAAAGKITAKSSSETQKNRLFQFCSLALG
jgi:hypothetical protein